MAVMSQASFCSNRDWVDVFMILLPVRVQTKGNSGAEFVEGTHAGAPRTSPPQEKGPVDHRYLGHVSGADHPGSILVGLVYVRRDVERLLHGPRRQIGGNKWVKGSQH